MSAGKAQAKLDWGCGMSSNQHSPKSTFGTHRRVKNTEGRPALTPKQAMHH
jgi:hypothetical protein